MTSSHMEPENQSSATLNQIDVHLAIEVFYDARDKLCFLEEIAPNLDQHKDELTLYVGQEIQRIIQSYTVLEDDFAERVLERDRMVLGGCTRREIEDMNSRVYALAERIRESTKELCKNLRENPTVTENLIKTQQHRSELLKWIKQALSDLQARQSYYSLETEISYRWMVHYEQQKLQQKEKEARARVDRMQREIQQEKHAHLEKITAQAKDLTDLKQALFYYKDRAENSIKLFQAELAAAGDEASRERLAEVNAQKQKIDQMIKAAEDEEKAYHVLFQAINDEYAKMSAMMTQTQQNCDNIISVLTTQRQLLEQERQEKAKKIEDLEAEDAANKAEKKAWEDEQAFLERMRAATQKTREMRAEVIRSYVIDKIVESLDPPMVKSKKSKKGKK